MGKFLQQLGEAATGSIPGAILGLTLGGFNDARQMRQQEDLQDLQIRGQKEMTDYQMMKQLEMWRNTSYGPQVAEMKKAGINPALLYGMSGGGGQTTGSASGTVQGAHAPVGGGEMPAMMGMGLQLQLLKAQKENIEADTANKKADIPVKTAQAPNIEADTLNKKAQNALINAQAKMQTIANEVAGATIDEAIYKITAEMAKSQQEVMQLEVKTEIDRATKNDTITQIKAEAIGALLKNLQTKAQTEETKAQIAKIAQEISKSQDEQYKTMPEQRKLISAQIQGIWNAIRKSYEDGNTDATGIINDIIKALPLPK